METFQSSGGYRECVFCIELPKNPRLLPCLHSFCSDCLTKHIAVSRESTDPGHVACPFCRAVITTPPNGTFGFVSDLSGLKFTALKAEISGKPACTGESELESITNSMNELQELTVKMRKQLLSMHEERMQLHFMMEAEKERELTAAHSKSKKSKKPRPAPPEARYQAGIGRVMQTESLLYKNFETIHAFLNLWEDVGPRPSPKSNFVKALKTEIDSFVKDLQPKVSAALSMKFGDELGAVGGSPQHPKQKKHDGAWALGKKKMQGQVEGVGLWNVGRRGIKPGCFNFPVHCSFFGADIAISDKNNHRIQMLDKTGRVIYKFLEGSVMPRRALQAPDGRIYVSDEFAECVIMYLPNGRQIGRFGDQKHFQAVAGIAQDSCGRIIMTCAERNFVSVHTPDGALITRFTTRTLMDRRVPCPYYICVNSNDEIIVSDGYNNCIKVFSQKGRVLNQFGTLDLNCPRGVCVDADDNIFVASGDSHSVEMFTKKGKYVQRVLSRADDLWYPAGLALGPNNMLVVTQFSMYSDHEVRAYRLIYPEAHR